MKRLTVCFCLVVSVASVVGGAEPRMIADRPDQSDSPFVLPRGLFQIEGGASYGRRNEPGEDLTVQAFPAALLRFGLEVFEADAESEVLAVTAGLVINPSGWI